MYVPGPEKIPEAGAHREISRFPVGQSATGCGCILWTARKEQFEANTLIERK